MPKKKNEKIYWTTKEAKNHAEKKGISITIVTIINWCKKYKFGKQISMDNKKTKYGRWFINRIDFINFIDSIKEYYQ